MAYATLQDLITRYGERELIQLTDRAEPPSGAVDDQVALQALTEATNLINGYVAAQHKLPLAEVPAQLVDLCAVIARFNLWSDHASEEVRQRYEDAVKTLRDISRGVVKLPIAAGGEPAARDDVVVIRSEPRLFSRSSMRGL